MAENPKAKRLAKLLATAMDQAGTPEGDLASRRAKEMMDRYGLTEEDAATTDFELNDHEIGRHNWKRSLYLAASIATGTFVAVTGSGTGMRVYGKHDRVVLCRYLFGALVNQCEAALRLSRRSGRAQMNSFRRSFAAGAMEKANKIAHGNSEIAQSLLPLSEAQKARKWAESQHAFGNMTTRYREDKGGRLAGQSARFSSGIRSGQGQRRLGAG